MKRGIDTRTLCGTCRADYENSGYMFSKIREQQCKDNCDLCRIRKGWEYEVERRG